MNTNNYKIPHSGQAYLAALGRMTEPMRQGADRTVARSLAEAEGKQVRVASEEERRLRYWCAVCDTNFEVAQRMGWGTSISQGSQFVQSCKRWGIETPVQRKKRLKREEIQDTINNYNRA